MAYSSSPPEDWKLFTSISIWNSADRRVSVNIQGWCDRLAINQGNHFNRTNGLVKWRLLKEGIRNTVGFDITNMSSVPVGCWRLWQIGQVSWQVQHVAISGPPYDSKLKESPWATTLTLETVNSSTHKLMSILWLYKYIGKKINISIFSKAWSFISKKLICTWFLPSLVGITGTQWFYRREFWNFLNVLSLICCYYFPHGIRCGPSFDETWILIT